MRIAVFIALYLMAACVVWLPVQVQDELYSTCLGHQTPPGRSAPTSH